MIDPLRYIVIICTVYMSVYEQLWMIFVKQSVKALEASVRNSLKIVEMTRGSVSDKYVKAFVPLYPEPELTDSVKHLLLRVHIFTVAVFL